MSAMDLHRASGVSYDIINKLKQRPESTTNAEAGRKLAASLGLQWEDGPEGSAISETIATGDNGLVPVYDVTASAGHGSVVETESVICNLAFDRTFLRRMTEAAPGDLSIIRVKGHSMEPTLLDDDHVLVDHTKKNLSWDGMFVLRFDDALHVKRIGRSATRGNVMVISDHAAYRDLDMPKSELNVVGRVIWIGRRV
ncbi:S24 family peptidase [Pseudogemmobacter sonorensis]|uniref:S24 family peptidase n=1 Tax=Pseudogemmobacter sonorensis TaxID=2989681 RepID=UPI0036756687